MTRFGSRRLVFRPLTDDDAAAIAALHADPRVSRLLFDGVPDTLPKARIFLDWNRRFDGTGYGTFAVERRDGPGLIGLYSLIPFEDDEHLLELGGKMHPIAWRGGLAVEAGEAMIEYAFTELDRDRLVSAIHPDNRSAARALATLRFEDDGEREVFGWRVTLMRLSRSTWRANRSDYGPSRAVDPYGLQTVVAHARC